MRKNKLSFLFLLAGLLPLFLIPGCIPEKKDKTKDILSDSIVVDGIKMTGETVNQMISSIPNPIIMSELLKEAGVVYSKDLLNPESNVDHYNTNFKKALNLGVYGTDLVHMNMYDRTMTTVSYLQNVKDLADDLRIGQFFDYETLNRLSESSRNVDSVLYITNHGFDNMSRYLIEQGRSNIAVLISYGTWIESLYIATNNINNIPENNDEVYQRIGEQKIVLDNMLLLLEIYHREDPEFEELYRDLVNLKKEFDEVKISYIYEEPITKEVDGSIVVIDNSRSEVKINKGIIENIAQQVEYIRNKII